MDRYSIAPSMTAYTLSYTVRAASVFPIVYM